MNAMELIERIRNAKEIALSASSELQRLLDEAERSYAAINEFHKTYEVMGDELTGIADDLSNASSKLQNVANEFYSEM